MENENNVQKIRFTASQVAEFIMQWKQSGKNRKKFCQEKGLNYYTFGSWLDKAKKKGSLLSGFKEVQIQLDSPVFAQVHLPGGIKIEFYQALPAAYFQSLLHR